MDGLYERNCQLLGAKVPDKIEAYYFNDPAQADAIMGAQLNFAAPLQRAFYSHHNATPAHEMTHVISFYVGTRDRKKRPRSRFLNEGLGGTGLLDIKRQIDLNALTTASIESPPMEPQNSASATGD